MDIAADGIGRKTIFHSCAPHVVTKTTQPMANVKNHPAVARIPCFRNHLSLVVDNRRWLCTVKTMGHNIARAQRLNQIAQRHIGIADMNHQWFFAPIGSLQSNLQQIANIRITAHALVQTHLNTQCCFRVIQNRLRAFTGRHIALIHHLAAPPGQPDARQIDIGQNAR